MRIRTILPLLIISTSLVACQEKKQLTEMHDATVGMSGTTLEMKQITADMKTLTSDKMTQVVASTKAVGVRSDQLFDIARHDGTARSRRESLVAMKTATSIDLKIGEAATYFMSFEYQYWEGLQGPDRDLSKRQNLIDTAAEEFIKTARDFYDSKTEVNIFSAFEQDQNFNALATALFVIDRKQEDMLNQRTDVAKVSMLSIIENALKEDALVRTGKMNLTDLSKASQHVLEYKELAIKLIQTHHNVLIAASVLNNSPIKEYNVNSLWGKIQIFVKTNQLALMNSGFVYDVTALSSGQISKYKFYLQLASEAQAFLKELGQKLDFDKTLSGILSHMKISTEVRKKDSLEMQVSQQALGGYLTQQIEEAATASK